MLNTRSITFDTSVVQNKGNIASDMDGEKVLMSIANSKYYNLGQVGGVIWDLIKMPMNVSSLVDTLMSQYEVEKSECEEQVISFLNILCKEGLVVIGDEEVVLSLLDTGRINNDE